MTYYQDTPLKDLFDKGYISRRTYNSLVNAGLPTLGDVARYSDDTEELLKLRNFGLKSLTEIRPILAAMAEDNTPAQVPANDYDRLDAQLKEYMDIIFMQLKEKLSRRGITFIESFMPRFADMFAFLEKGPDAFKAICPGTNKKKTIADVFNFSRRLKTEFDRVRDLEGSEIEDLLLDLYFDFLGREERDFIKDFLKQHSRLPLFFILKQYLLTSTHQSDKAYVARFGIGDGTQRTLAETALLLDITGERIRQICSGRINVQSTPIVSHKDWSHYAGLFSLPYISRHSPLYEEINRIEHLDLSFESFSALVLLVSNFSIVRFARYDDWFILVNSDIDSVRLKDQVRMLYARFNEKHASEKFESLEETVGEMPERHKELLIDVLKTSFGFEFDQDGKYRLFQNAIDISDELYRILEHNGVPTHIEELFKAFKAKYPEHKYTDYSQIKHFLYQHPHIKPIGKSSLYALDNWDGLFFGSIRELLIQTLEAADQPLHIDFLFQRVLQHYPNTNKASVNATMVDEEKSRFRAFEGGYYGLASKSYPDGFVVSLHGKRFRFEERLASFKKFVEENHRFPFHNPEDEEESSLMRWYYNVTKGRPSQHLTEDQRTALEETKDKYSRLRIPTNSAEIEFKRNCGFVKEFLATHNTLPGHKTAPELYSWLIRSRKKYKTFKDHRKSYMDDLIRHAYTLGFII